MKTLEGGITEWTFNTRTEIDSLLNEREDFWKRECTATPGLYLLANGGMLEIFPMAQGGWLVTHFPARTDD